MTATRKMLRSVWPLHGKPETNADGYVFRLHYRGTTTVCFVACVLLLVARYLASPMHCISSERNLEKMTSFCWMSPTYTLNHPNRRTGDIDHPGVWSRSEEEETSYTNYYIWIPLFLAISGFLFYLPHVIWRLLEDKNLERLLQGPNIWPLDEDTAKKNIARYIEDTRGKNCVYAFPYLFCEILNLVNVIAQLVIMDLIVGGFFSKNGAEVFSQIVSVDVGENGLQDTFPTMIKCEFNKYGSSGAIERHDLHCALPQNVLNKIVFIFMWVWFCALATITAAEVVLMMLMYMSHSLRLGMLEYRGKLTVSPDIQKGVSSMSCGDYFFLYLLARHLDTVTFRAILTQVCSSGNLYPSVPSSDYSAL